MVPLPNHRIETEAFGAAHPGLYNWKGSAENKSAMNLNFDPNKFVVDGICKSAIYDFANEELKSIPKKYSLIIKKIQQDIILTYEEFQALKNAKIIDNDNKIPIPHTIKDIQLSQ